MTSHRREAFVLTVATGLIGITFGVLADSAGLSLVQAAALSALTFTGASQFAAVSVVGAGGNPVAAVGSGLLLAARNSLYGPVVAPVLRSRPGRRAVAAHFVIDETTAMASAQDDPVDARDALLVHRTVAVRVLEPGHDRRRAGRGLLDDPDALGPRRRIPLRHSWR